MPGAPATLIYAVRHAESHANVRLVLSNGRRYDAALTTRGRRQAERLVAWLGARGIVHLYYSPLRRAAETGAIIARALGLPATPMPALREIDVGSLDGRGDPATWQHHDAVLACWYAGHDDVAFPGGETLAEARARATEALQTIAERHAGAAVGVITHNMIARIALARLAPFPAAAIDDPVYRLRHGDIGVLRRDAGGWTCLAWGVRPALSQSPRRV